MFNSHYVDLLGTAVRFDVYEQGQVLFSEVLKYMAGYAREWRGNEPDKFVSIGEKGPFFVHIAGVSRPYPSLHDALLYILDNIEFECVWRQQQGVAIHAALVSSDQHCLLLPGSSKSGKSTLSQFLCQKGGYSLWTDEYVIISSEGVLYPFQRAVRLRDENGRRVLQPPSIRPEQEIRQADVLFSCYQENDDADLSLKKLDAGRGVLSLIENSVVLEYGAKELKTLSAFAERSLFASLSRGKLEEQGDKLLELIRRQAFS